MGYNGWIMTDWDVMSADGACLAAGCDTCMPGRYKTFEELSQDGLARAVAQQRAAQLIAHLAKTKHYFNEKLKNT
mgnify:CR=1 FL=1